MHIGWPQILIATAALVGGSEAAALGFGQIRSSVVLGQPLNVAIPVNLAAGETLAAECVGAEVSYGDSPLPPIYVRVGLIQGSAGADSLLQVSASTVIDEPVLTLTLSVGCASKLSRTVVLLADPPLVNIASVPPEIPAAAAAAVQPSSPKAASQPAASAAPARASRPAKPRRAIRTRPSVPARAAVAEAASAASAPGLAAAAASAPSVARAEPKSRLRLDAGQVSFEPAAVLAAQEQASAARATASAAETAASAANERMRAMEGDVARMRADAKAQTDSLLQLRQQLALDRARRDEPSPLTYVLLAVAALFALLAAWLGWRLRKQVRSAPASIDWWEQSASASSAAAMAEPPVAAEVEPAPRSTRPSALQRMAPAPAPWSDEVESRSGDIDLLIAPPTVPAPTAVTIPTLMPATPLVTSDEQARGAMSVDEQIDLEQQADFFIALGHDEAAIDLLMAHMRSTGGGSPLPFLKLLEIHRRRHQRDDYERTRVRFNQRFNSVAPEWQADPKLGRMLEDYALPLGRIQRAWPSPLDAMAELEALLFRRGPGAELFDMPAYQEVLFLYQTARDLHAAEGQGGVADVDVLLPIGGRSGPIAASEGTIVLRPEFNAGEPLSLDLDLTTGHGQVPPALPPEPALSLLAVKSEGQPPADDDDEAPGDNPDTQPTPP